MEIMVQQITFKVYGVLEQSNNICQIGIMSYTNTNKVIFLKSELSSYRAMGKKFRTTLDITTSDNVDKYLGSLKCKSLLVESTNIVEDEEVDKDVLRHFEDLKLAESIFSSGDPRQAWVENANNFFGECIRQEKELYN